MGWLALVSQPRDSARSHTVSILANPVSVLLAGVALGTFVACAQAQFTTPSTFAAQSNGNFTGTIPIRLPPSTGGLAPSPAIAYNSHGGNGLLGVGWTLEGLSAIARCPQTMAQDGIRGSVNFDANDRFCLDGARLILVSGSSYGVDGAQYRTEIDSYAQITSHGATGVGPTYFTVQTKSGLTKTYGNTGNSGVVALGGSSIRVWALSSVADPLGNSYSLSYTVDTANGAYYPHQISFTANSASPAQNAVTFTYQSQNRSDVITTWTHGSMVRIVQRLSQITVTTTGSQEVREYRLGYDNGGNGNASRLTSVQECASSTGPCLPTISIGWSGGAASAGFSAQPSFSSSNASAACGSLIGPASVDFNGDGRADYLCTHFNSSNNLSGQFTVILSGGKGTFTVEPTWPANGATPFCANGSVGSPFAADFDGDGKVDLLCELGNGSQFYGTYQVAFSNGDGTFNPKSVWPTSGTFCFGGTVHTLDVNGDGRTDLVCELYSNPNATYYFYVALSNGDGTFNFINTPWPASGVFCPSSGVVGFGDFNGDGLQDAVCLKSTTSGSTTTTTVTVALSNGNGTFTQKAPWTTTSLGCGGGSLTFADLNGDGKQDLICLGKGTYMVAFSQGDGTFSLAPGGAWPPGGGTWCEWPSPNGPAFGTVYGEIALADFNSDGKQDMACMGTSPNNQFMIAYSNGDGTFTSSGWYPTSGASPCNNTYSSVWAAMDVDGTGSAAMACIEEPSAGTINYVSSAGTPDLLASISNGIGYATSVSYLPMTNSSVYTKDSGANAAAYPIVDVQAPYYVVASIQVPNGVGGTNATNYAFGGLKVDLSGRGSLGFRWMSATDAQTSLNTTTTYLQTFPYTGQASTLTRSLPGSGNGGTLLSTTNTAGCTGY